MRPDKVRPELRIYQNDDILEETMDPDRVEEIMYNIREKDSWAEEFRGEN